MTLIIICFFVSFFVVTVVERYFSWQRSQKKPSHVDYKERWQQAVELLGAQGQLTDDQVRLIKGEDPSAPVAVTPAPPVKPEAPSAATLKMLHGMEDWARCDLEVARAKKGLPPVDDLEGMEDWAVADVMKARMKYGTAQ